MSIRCQRGFSPSLLARKILCVAYVSAPLSDEACFRLRALHSMALVTVIGRYLKSGYRLLAVERGGNGYRTDLLFEASLSAKKRLVEVKSSQRIREVHKIQAALYAHKITADEISVSNRDSDEILTVEFIQEIRERAESTRLFLTNESVRAAATYTPHPDVCYTCANSACRFLRRPPVSAFRTQRS